MSEPLCQLRATVCRQRIDQALAWYVKHAPEAAARVLLDIDEAALAATLKGVFKDPSLRARVEPRVMDVTGINGALVKAIDEIIASAADAAEAERRFGELGRGYRLTSASLVPGGERA